MKKELEARLDSFHFRPSSEQQVVQVDILSYVLYGEQFGRVSKLLRQALDELLDRHADQIEAARPLYEAKLKADAALASLGEG